MQTKYNLSSELFQSVEPVWRHGTDGSDRVGIEQRELERETFKSSLLSHLVTPARSLHEPVVIVGLSSEAKKLLDLVVLLCCTESRLLLFFFELAANCCFLLFKNTQRWVTQTLARSLFFLQISARLQLLLSS